MENVIEYFESQEDALEFAKCLDCVNYLIDQDIIIMACVGEHLFDKFSAYTKHSIRDSLMRRELFSNILYKKE